MCYVEVFVLLYVLEHPRHRRPVHVVDQVDIDEDEHSDRLALVQVLPPARDGGEEKSVRKLNCVGRTLWLLRSHLKLYHIIPT